MLVVKLRLSMTLGQPQRLGLRAVCLPTNITWTDSSVSRTRHSSRWRMLSKTNIINRNYCSIGNLFPPITTYLLRRLVMSGEGRCPNLTARCDNSRFRRLRSITALDVSKHVDHLHSCRRFGFDVHLSFPRGLQDASRLSMKPE